MQQEPLGGPGPAPQQPYPPAQIPNEPNAVTAMVLGIVGVVACGILAPFAWVMGKKSMDNIARNPAAYSGEGMAKAGYILGIIGTILLIVGVLFMIIYFLFIGLLIGAEFDRWSAWFLPLAG